MAVLLEKQVVEIIQKNLTTIYQSSSDIKRNNKLLKLPGDSKKNIKKQLIINFYI